MLPDLEMIRRHSAVASGKPFQLLLVLLSGESLSCPEMALPAKQLPLESEKLAFLPHQPRPMLMQNACASLHDDVHADEFSFRVSFCEIFRGSRATPLSATAAFLLVAVL